MMNPRRLIYLALLLLQFDLQAQSGFSKDRVHGAVGVAIVDGQSATSGQLSIDASYDLTPKLTVHTGAALDYYLARTVPIFVELSRDLGNKPRHFFLYAGGGVNLAWPTDEERIPSGGWGVIGPVRYGTGLYSHAGIGRTLGKQEGRGFVVRLGHTFKSFTESYQERVWTGMAWTEAERENRFGLGRLLFSLQFKL